MSEFLVIILCCSWEHRVIVLWSLRAPAFSFAMKRLHRILAHPGLFSWRKRKITRRKVASEAGERSVFPSCNSRVWIMSIVQGLSGNLVGVWEDSYFASHGGDSKLALFAACLRVLQVGTFEGPRLEGNASSMQPRVQLCVGCWRVISWH